MGVPDELAFGAVRLSLGRMTTVTEVDAAVQAAKRTAELIPLAHPIAITRVAAEFKCDAARSEISLIATVECRGRTGVEMEALTAAAVGLLTIYDMVKAVDRGMVIRELRLEEKRGGKSGIYQRKTVK